MIETTKREYIIEFIRFVVNELGINHNVPVHLTKKRNDMIRTTAAYNIAESIHIYIKDRALVDILRSIAHELVHHKQYEEGRLKDTTIIPDIGGEIEDEANAIAGQLIKKFCYNNKIIYEM